MKELQWSKAQKRLPWKEAKAWCENCKEGGHRDWRLPTVQELVSIIDYSLYEPATKLRGMKSNWYWSSSTYQSDPSYAWYVYFDDGNVIENNKTSSGDVRAVRGSLKTKLASTKEN